MPSHVQPRRIIINGHPTSVRLEPAYWGWLRESKGSKKTEATVEIKPPVQDGINNPVVVRQDSNVQVISGKFLGDFQRHYDEKGYKIFDWVFETNPLAHFTALVGLSNSGTSHLGQ